MPFQSEMQRRFLYSKKPSVARKFEEHGGLKARHAYRVRKKKKKKGYA